MYPIRIDRYISFQSSTVIPSLLVSSISISSYCFRTFSALSIAPNLIHAFNKTLIDRTDGFMVSSPSKYISFISSSSRSASATSSSALEYAYALKHVTYVIASGFTLILPNDERLSILLKRSPARLEAPFRPFLDNRVHAAMTIVHVATLGSKCPSCRYCSNKLLRIDCAWPTPSQSFVCAYASTNDVKVLALGAQLDDSNPSINTIKSCARCGPSVSPLAFAYAVTTVLKTSTPMVVCPDDDNGGGNSSTAFRRIDSAFRAAPLLRAFATIWMYGEYTDGLGVNPYLGRSFPTINEAFRSIPLSPRHIDIDFKMISIDSIFGYVLAVAMAATVVEAVVVDDSSSSSRNSMTSCCSEKIFHIRSALLSASFFFSSSFQIASIALKKSSATGRNICSRSCRSSREMELSSSSSSSSSSSMSLLLLCSRTADDLHSSTRRYRRDSMAYDAFNGVPSALFSSTS